MSNLPHHCLTAAWLIVTTIIILIILPLYLRVGGERGNGSYVARVANA